MSKNFSFFTGHYKNILRLAPTMKKHEILSPQSRAVLFDPPTDPAAIVRHYTLSPEDLALIRQRRRDANRLGFALHLAYLRFPGRVLGAEETPPPDMLAFIAGQLGIKQKTFGDYARRKETRWEHIGGLQGYLKVRPFQREDHRAVAKVALEEATGTDRGDVIVTAMISHLRNNSILLPASVTLEKIGLAARARARKLAYQSLVEGLPKQTIAALEALIVIDGDEDHTPLTWLREWSEAPARKNLAGIIERLHSIRRLNVEADREKRIHRARYAAIARETAILSAQHLSRFDQQRRLATLVVFVREMEAILTDAGITMFDKMLGSVFRKADHEHKERMVDQATALAASTRVLLGMAKALLAAKASGTDPLAAVENEIGWQRLETLVKEVDAAVGLMLAKTILQRSLRSIRRCAVLCRGCSARSYSAPGRPTIPCSALSTCCAVFMQRESGSFLPTSQQRSLSPRGAGLLVSVRRATAELMKWP